MKRRRIQDDMVRADVIVRRRAFYWRFVEYGTTRLTANPFFLRTLRRFESRAMRSFLAQFVRRFEAALARARR